MLSRPNTCTRRSRSPAASAGRFSASARADAAGQAPRERDDARRVALEQRPVDARLVVVALQEAERGEPDQVRVALVRLGQQRQVRVALGLRPAVVADVDLAADQRLDAVLARLPVEVDGAGQRAVIGERDRGHLPLGGAGGERGDAARPVEDRELGVDVEVDELGGPRRRSLGRPRDGTPVGRAGAAASRPGLDPRAEPPREPGRGRPA